MRLPQIALRHHAALPGPPDDVRVTASVGPHGEVITVWAAAEDIAALTSSNTSPGGASFPDTVVSRPVSARVVMHAPEATAVASLPDVPLAHIEAQPLPQDRILLVGARARWRPEGPERNAIIYDSTGDVVHQETLGDGIEHVLTTATGHVWVGYFDEGVYGNYGWGETTSAPPVGERGLRRFTPDLQPEWEFPSHVDEQWGAISDCYALNVDGETAWACYYTDFPIVRIHGDSVSGWHNDVGGARALAVDGARVALLGGYRAERDRLAVGVLEGGSFHLTGEYRVSLPDGGPIPAGVRLAGRGADLHLITDNDWYRVSLDDVPERPAGHLGDHG